MDNNKWVEPEFNTNTQDNNKWVEPEFNGSQYGLRNDGTEKGPGFLGEISTDKGNVMTELSVGVGLNGKETEIPLLVPTLTKDEIDYLKVEGNEPTQEILDKAVSHAKDRMNKGLSPFYGPGENPPNGQRGLLEGTELETLKNVGAGIIQGTNSLMTKVNIALDEALGAIGFRGEEETKNLIAKRKKQQKGMYEYLETGTLAGAAGKLVGEYGPAALLPSSTAPRAILSMAGMGALEREGDRFRGALIGGGTAALGLGAFKAGRMAYDKFRPTRAMEAQLAKQLSPAEVTEAQKTLKLARKYNAPMTPGTAGQIPGQSGQLLKWERDNLIPTQKSIDIAKTIDTQSGTNLAKDMLRNLYKVAPKNAKEQAQRLYKGLENLTVRKAVKTKLDNDADLLGVLADIQKQSPTAQNKLASAGFKKGTYGYYQKLGEYARDTAQDMRRQGVNQLDIKVYQDAADTIKSTLVNSSPAFKAANKLYAKGIVRETFDTQLSEAGGRGMDKVYKAFLNTGKKRQAFYENIKAVGGNIQQAKDLVYLIDKLKNSPLKRFIEKGEGVSGNSVGPGSNAKLKLLATLTNYANKVLQGSYTDSYIKLMLNPNLAKDLSRIRKIKDYRTQLDALGEILSKVSAQKASGIGKE